VIDTRHADALDPLRDRPITLGRTGCPCALFVVLFFHRVTARQRRRRCLCFFSSIHSFSSTPSPTTTVSSLFISPPTPNPLSLF